MDAGQIRPVAIAVGPMTRVMSEPMTSEGLEELVREHAALRRVATLVARLPSPCEVFAAVRREVGMLVGAQPRLVETADEARPRIERDLHDGAQQQFVAAALELTVLEQRLAPVELRATVPDGLDRAIEAAAYFIVSEALTNVAKYARAESVSVDVAPSEGTLVVTVADDGVGGADPEGGSGLRGLGDRVEAVGGRLEVDSVRGRGTRLCARLPMRVLGSIDGDEHGG